MSGRYVADDVWIFRAIWREPAWYTVHDVIIVLTRRDTRIHETEKHTISGLTWGCALTLACRRPYDLLVHPIEKCLLQHTCTQRRVDSTLRLESRVRKTAPQLIWNNPYNMLHETFLEMRIKNFLWYHKNKFLVVLKRLLVFKPTVSESIQCASQFLHIPPKKLLMLSHEWNILHTSNKFLSFIHSIH